MTVMSENKRNQYTITEGQTVFPYTFRILNQEHLFVVYADSAGNETELEITANYTIDGVGDAGGGNVTTCGDNSPYSTGGTVTIIRDVPITQLIDYVENDMFPAETHEKGLDKATMILQQFLELLNRTLRFPIGSALKNLFIPTATSRVIGWDALGENLTTYPIGAAAYDPHWDSIQNYDDDLATAVATIGGAAKTLLIDVSTESVVENLEVPETLELFPIRTGLITIDNCTLKINKLSDAAGLYKIFNCINGGIVEFGRGAVKKMRAELWGFSTSASLAVNTAALQACVNAAAKGGHTPVELPSGRYQYHKLLLHYDAVNNPGWPSTTYQEGRLIIRGAGRGNFRDRDNDQYNGTILDSQDATGPGIQCGNGEDDATIAMLLEDFNVWVNNTTKGIYYNRVNASSIKRVFVDQDGAGDGIVVRDCWKSNFEDLFCYGAGSATGKGFWVYNKDHAGGNVRINNVTGRNFQVGVLIGGPTYDTELYTGIRGIAGDNLQGIECASGILFGCGLNFSTFRSTWVETNTACGIRIFNRANDLTFDGIICYNPAATEADVVLGLSGGTNDQITHANLLIRHLGCLAVHVAGVKRYVSLDCKNVTLFRPSFGINAEDDPYGIDLAAEAQHNLSIIDPTFTGFTPAKEINGYQRAEVISNNNFQRQGYVRNSQYLELQTSEKDLTLTGASVAWSGAFPDGCIGLGVSAEITTEIVLDGGTDWQVGDGTDVDRWGTSSTLIVGTKLEMKDWTADDYTWIRRGTELSIVLTPNAGTFTSGVVRITMWYISLNI